MPNLAAQSHHEVTEPALAVEKQLFRDFDKFLEASAWDFCDWRQVEGGPIRVRLEQVLAPSALLLRIHASRRFKQTGTSPAHMRSFALIDEFVPGTELCRRDMDSDSLLAFGDAGEYEAITPSGWSAFTLAFPLDLLSSVACDLGLPDAAEMLPNVNVVSVCRQGFLDALRLELRRIINLATDGHPGAPNEARERLEFDVPAALLGALAERRREIRPPLPRRRDVAFRRAMRFIEDHPARPVSVQDVRAASGVSLRTLEYAFRERLGMTPKAYIKAVRLNEARRALAAAPPSATIAEIVGRSGFWHMGAFAADYREMFGELPSETRRR